MARILIVGGGCRGRRLARELVDGGHAVRISTRSPEGCRDIEAAGAECWIGDPDRLATMRAALDGVSVLCWLLATASGQPAAVVALHTTRLRFLLTQAIDTTVRGFVHEAPVRGRTPSEGIGGDGLTGPGGNGRDPGDPAAALIQGARAAGELAKLHAIPAVCLTADPRDDRAWRAEARAAIDRLLGIA